MWQEVLIPVYPEAIISKDLLNNRQIGLNLKPAQQGGLTIDDLVIITVGPGEQFLEFRKELYQLYQKEDSGQVADLGSLEIVDKNEIPAALSLCLEPLLEKGIRCVVIGREDFWTAGLYKAMVKRGEMACMSRFTNAVLADISQPDNWLGRIISGADGFLYKFAHLGYQNYLSDPVGMKMLDSMHFDHIRLGELRQSLSIAEPLLRETDILQFDMNCVKGNEAPGQSNPGPNGFYAEEACHIMRYGGMGDHMQSVAITGYQPEADEKGKSAKLIAQMVWHFLDGMDLRRNESPFENSQGFTKFMVDLEEVEDGLIFWKSQKTSRWWMQLPHAGNPKLEKFTLLPCSYQDYQQACQGELPDRWMKAYSRLMTD